MTFARWLTIVTVVAGPALAREAGAQTPAPAAGGTDRAAMAEVLFDEGRHLVLSGRYSEGCAKFAESERLDHGVGTLLNLADCYERAGLLASAWTQFRAAAAAAAEAGQPDRLAVAQERMVALTSQVQRLAIRVPPADAMMPQFELRRDDITLEQALWGVAVPVDPGPHRIEARALNRKPFSIVIDVPVRRAAVVTQNVPILEEPGSEAAADATPFAPRSSAAPVAGSAQGSGGASTAAVALFGGAALGIGVGTVFGARALVLNGSSNDHCVGNRCDASGVDTRNSARSSGNVSTIAFVAAGVLAAGGLAVVLLNHSNKAGPSASVTLVPSSGGASLVGGGYF